MTIDHAKRLDRRTPRAGSWEQRRRIDALIVQVAAIAAALGKQPINTFPATSAGA